MGSGDGADVEGGGRGVVVDSPERGGDEDRSRGRHPGREVVGVVVELVVAVLVQY